MKNDIIKIIGGGIKCDNKKCDYADETVEIKDYKNWLNKPCPKCGSNLLTQADYNNVQELIKLATFINKNEEIHESTEKESTITFHMDGSGEVEIEVNELE